MVNANETIVSNVSATPGYVILGISVAIGSLILAYCVASCFEKEIHAACLQIGCTVCLPKKIHPDGSTGPIGVRPPTSAERIMALGILSRSQKGTTLDDVLADLVKGPPRNNFLEPNQIRPTVPLQNEPMS